MNHDTYPDVKKTKVNNKLVFGIKVITALLHSHKSNSL